MLKNLKYLRVIDPDPTALILEKIRIAENLFKDWGEYFLGDEKFINLLEDYKIAILKSNELMENLGSFKECYRCSVEENKGCCKIGLENEVTINILLINMFFKTLIPQEREVPGRCFFVGPRGCKIFARPYLCREFFCNRLLRLFSPEEYALLTQTISYELTLLYKICVYIRKELEYLLGDFLLELDIAGYS
ncbi:hypothetical protein TOPB45_0414 [Thermodesulfobacterium geofontis OPF15]|jgi:hypothetical protein|uniref:Uncharacterized protein n=1 Tax=Thermodesulfobacterium geofontis (strain OPF15) TaxID=795359 RepID=F8C3Y0_THEGP|nr:hypothetical protein [Thermodesulfobacterium geofontis]AEH22518.1 hypothetical protein TOPB45_0414 [Thermodesulfobacterium geofontis OPF15]